MKTITKAGLKLRVSVKAGGLGSNNHNPGGLKVTSGLKAGSICRRNHNLVALTIR